MWLAAALWVLGSSNGAWAFDEAPHGYPTGPQARVYHDTTAPGTVSPFTRRGELERFQERHGGRWDAYWDSLTDTPFWVRGSGLAVVSPWQRNAQVVVDRLLAFVGRNPGLFRVEPEELVPLHAYRNGDLWYVDFLRTYRGIPVHLSSVRFRLKSGRLVLFSAESYPGIELDPTPVVSASEALEAAGMEIPFVPGTDEVAREPELRIYPDLRYGGLEYRLAWYLETRNAEPHGWFGTFVDAHTAELLEVFDRHAYAYSGQVQMDTDERTVGDPIVTVPGAFNQVAVSGLGSQDTDESGAFSFSGSGGARGITSALRGRHVEVDNRGGSDAFFSGSISDGVPFTLSWDDANSHLAERDTFYGVNRTNRFVHRVFPNLNWINNVSLSANVNLNQTCNAFWNGFSINFFRAGGGCNNTGRIFDVVAHEWGHGLDQNAPGGAQSGALGEFIGDLLSWVQTRDPEVGPGFFTSGGWVRSMEDPEYDCYDPRISEVHAAGNLLGNVVWDIFVQMENSGITGDELYRRMILPVAGAQTRSQWYGEMLVVDDDDGNLANGTPNQCLIYHQFKVHGCNGIRWPGLPPGDPPNCAEGGRDIFPASDVPQAIPDGDATGVTSSLEIQNGSTIDDLDVSVDIPHTAIGDLRLVLSHSSTDTVSVVLHDRSGGDRDDLITNYDRQSSPRDPLSVLNGRNSGGIWTLEVQDLATGNTGTLRGWQIEVRPL